MSTPEQPTPPLTRKQIRDLRNTAANPIITPEGTPAETPVVAAPLPRPAAPAEVPPAPASDASVDLGARPLTRRQARQQERIRTASVPVITADVIAAHAADMAERNESPFAAPTDAATEDESADPADDASRAEDAPEAENAPEAEDTAETEDAPEPEPDEAADEPAVAAADETADVEEERPVVNSALGAELLAGEAVSAELPASFDHILARSTGNGSLTASNALILSQTPSSGPLVGPVTATGEVLITGTFALPEGLGSNGHAPGVADGKDVDAALIDGELPPASSPTPIAASAAVSTSKAAGEIIQPPAPEKGGRLMMALAITAGVLALTLVGVLILAVTTGVFS
ncbi:hypothetical protein H9651_02600 [Microbacterium sp. Sa4CUA7]|uniref:Uncharacterized protein n=1 Tax=Microbacterium pullorum TaxID=2762236 RepID=A0ABR8RZ83_9MICO|nr:hypothetical protein [Microbacterium pullorum]MBD7956523.1 hypothetical protein [Microbacterium pullorum]